MVNITTVCVCVCVCVCVLAWGYVLAVMQGGRGSVAAAARLET